MNQIKRTFSLVLMVFFAAVTLFPIQVLAADTTPPAISIPLETSYTAGEHYTVNVIVTDYQSGVKSKEIYFDNRSVSQGQSILLEEGYHAVRVVAVDNAGNQSTKQAAFYAEASAASDTTPPAISIPLASSYTAGDYYNVNVTVTDSESGVKSTTIYFDNSPVNNGQSIQLTEGYHAVRVVAYDNADNRAEKQVALNAEASTPNDTTPPSISIPLNSTYYAGDVYTVNVIVTDSGSGVASTTIYFDNSTVSQGQNITLSAGYHTIRVTARDNAGNQAQKQATLNAVENDTTPPTITIPLGSGYEEGDTYVVNVIVTDSGSGVDTVTIRFDNNTVSQGQSITLTAGTHAINVTARDKAGNQAQKQETFNVGTSYSNDDTPPAISIPLNTPYYEGDSYVVNVIVQDFQSGVASTNIYFDNNPVNQGQSITLTAGTHTVRATARDNAGNESQKQASFEAIHRDSSRPYVISTNPAQNASGVERNPLVSFTFNENILQGTNFNNITISGSGAYLGAKSISNRVLTINTTAPNYNTQYTINIPAGAVKDSNGNNCEAYSLTFRTVTSQDNDNPYVIWTSPGNGTTGVERNRTVTFRFNESVVSGSNYNNITISGSGSYLGSQSLSGDTLTVNTTTPYYNTQYTIYIPQGAVKDSQGNPNTPYNLTFTTRSSGESDDYTPPTVYVYPSSGTIQPGARVINISANDPSGIYKIGYQWDNDSSNQVTYTNSVTITAPHSTGTHTLRVYAQDNSPNRNHSGWKSYFYTIGGDIIYPGGPGEGTINPNVKTLKVELRNAEDRIKYAVNEEILYYVDYYNGTRSHQDNIEVVFNVPQDFSVTDRYQGTIQGNTVVWNLGTLEPLQSGRLLVKVRCESSSMDERIVMLTAKLNKNGASQDSSMLRNMIFRTDASGYHQRYIYGYPDGSFRPERGMTRAEFAAMLVRLFNIETPSSAYSYMNPYKDINTRKSTWAYDSIIACTREGLFGGYPDGTFKPENIVTRAEFSAVLARKLNVHDVQTIWIHADDLLNHWAMDEMEQLIRMNIIKGYPDETARPDRTISRAEAVTLLNRFTFRGQLNINKSSFWDVKTSHWAIKEIEEAARNHSYRRDSVGDEEMR